MNLLCPNCQKMLTVPEQFAGQLMKCPLCSGTFTVPALPPPSTVEVPAFGTTPPAAPPPPAPSGPPEPAFTPAPAPPVPAFSSGPAEPAFTTTPSPSLSPSPASSAGEAYPSRIGLDSGDYTRTVRVTANERLLQWVAPAGMLLIFLLTFFSWVQIAPGGVPAVTQNAWQAAFGGYTEDIDMRKQFRIITDREAEDLKAKQGGDEIGNAPGVSPLLLFYLIFFVVTLLVSVFVAVLPFIKMPLPPQVQQVLPWKWAILAGLNAVLLLFLTLQLLLNFSLESTMAAWVENQPQVKRETIEKDKLDTRAKKEIEAYRGSMLQWRERTLWLWLAFLLHVVATAAAGLVYWMERRGPGKPAPTLELRW